MRVICIYNKWWSRNTQLPPVLPDVGNVYSVEGTKTYANKLYYKLNGFGAHAWEARYFIPLSDIDETEIMQERQEYKTVTK